MNSAFADTSFWIALLNPKDNLHAKAKAVAASLGPMRIVTTEMVLTELLNDFAARGPALRTACKQLVVQLSQSPKTTIVPQTSEQFHSALATYADRTDKAWGLTDCASAIVMRAYSTHKVLTYDRHFEQMGFQALLRD